MQKRLIMYLHSTDGLAISWVMLDTDNKIIQSESHGDLNKLLSTEGCEVYVFVPAQDVLLTHATLPKLSRQKLLQALPFALEEQLIDDVNELHFAIGQQQPDSSLPVAIVAKQKIENWLKQLEHLGIVPRVLASSVFTLPFSLKNWRVNCDEMNCLVRTDSYSGFACEKDNLEMLLNSKLAETSEQDIQINHTNYSTQQLLENIAPQIDSFVSINLLQGPYTPKVQAGKVKRLWLMSAYLAAIFILLAFVSDFISYFILHHQANRLETAINQIYKRNFPNASSIVAPKERMADKLRSASGQASKNNFLVLLAKVADSLAKAPAVRIQTFDYREQHLTLEVIAAAFDNLDVFAKNLTAQGFNVKQQNAAVVGSQVKATLIIRAGSA